MGKSWSEWGENVGIIMITSTSADSRDDKQCLVRPWMSLCFDTYVWKCMKMPQTMQMTCSSNGPCLLSSKSPYLTCNKYERGIVTKVLNLHMAPFSQTTAINPWGLVYVAKVIRIKQTPRWQTCFTMSMGRYPTAICPPFVIEAYLFVRIWNAAFPLLYYWIQERPIQSWKLFPIKVMAKNYRMWNFSYSQPPFIWNETRLSRYTCTIFVKWPW